MEKRKRPKEETSEDYCFVCKDGGRLLICEYGDCLKAYHPVCVGKNESFLEAGEHWTCSWHTCFICHKSSNFQCFCCPSSVCRECIRATDFVQLRKTKGFCSYCLKLLILAEENADVDSDGGKLNFRDTETGEFLFKDYWNIIREQEKLSLKDLCEAETLLKKGENYKSSYESGQNFEEEGEVTSDAEARDKSFNLNMPFPDVKLFKNRRTASVKGSRFKKRDFRGWGSVELIEFLTFLGKDTSKTLNQWDVCKIIEKYVHENNLLHPNRKKKTVLCDQKLQSLFRKKTVRLIQIYNLLEGHFADNVDSDGSAFESEEDSDQVAEKKLRTNSDFHRKNKKENVHEPPKSCYASMIDKNIKLVYLRKSLLKEFLKNPETLEGKVVGCFVRVKSDPKDFDFSPNKLYMLRQVSGIKNTPEVYMVGETSTNIVLRVSNIWKDIRISMLSDDDFEEEECEDLRQLVKKDLFRRPTVVELEDKVRSIHEDIMSHWIKREISLLQRQIDRANEKGWNREKCEYIERRALLQKDSEQARLLKEIPKVIPDIQDLKDVPVLQLNLQRENKGKQSGPLERSVGTKAEGNGAALHEKSIKYEGSFSFCFTYRVPVFSLALWTSLF
uniref:Uncharacterized protein At5g08430 n=1 Tax=Anthurium amnicola TaxID=1678845 RepID=A0A1D1YNG2_9ARAE